MILILTHKWYDMIASGAKKEECRAQSPHNIKQFWRWCSRGDSIIEFRRGYTKESIRIRCNCSMLLSGAENNACDDFKRRNEWGFESGKPVIVYQLGEILEDKTSAATQMSAA